MLPPEIQQDNSQMQGPVYLACFNTTFADVLATQGAWVSIH